ncbi:MAG: glycosyltransferase [Fidelibacterota bacterium]
METPTVSVLIISYNVRQYLVQAIEALKKSVFQGEMEIVVVDNHSYDGTVEYIREEFPEVTILANEKNVGFGKGVNQAAKVARGDYYLILNPDTVVQENTIAVLMEYLQTHPKVGMVGPKILNADGHLQLSCKRSFPTVKVALPKVLGLHHLFPNSRWAGRYNLTYLDPDQIHTVDAISGSCMFLSRELFHQLHGFDEQFFMFGEDLDLCYRIWQAGYEIQYVPTTQIIHYQGESVKSAPYDSINAFYNAMILFANKHFSLGERLIMRWIILTGIGFRKFVSLLAERKSQILSVFLDAFVVLLAFSIAFPLRFGQFEALTVTKGLVPTIYVVFWLTVGAVFQLYSRYILSYSRAILASVTGFFLAVAFTYFFKQYAFSRLVIIIATVIITILIPGWRVGMHYLMSRGWLKRVKEKHPILFTSRTLVLGADEEGIRIARNIMKRLDTGLDVVGFCDRTLGPRSESLPLPFLGLLTDLRQIIATHAIRVIIFSSRSFSNQDIVSIMDQTKDLRLTYRILSRKQDILLGKAAIEEIGDFSFMNIEYTLFHRFNLVIKRLFDLIFAALLLVLLSPLIVWQFLRGRPRRVTFWGADGSQFTAYRFPTKRPFLRDLLLLIAVLKGKMSFVGAVLVESTERDPQLICAPGITGLVRIRKVAFEPEERNLLDHYYVQHQSLILDLEIMIRTLFNG